MAIQQLLISQKAGSSGAPVFTPSILSGLTYAMSANNSAIYKGASTSSGLATVDGDFAQRIDSLNSITRTLYSASGSPTFEVNLFGSSLNGIFADDQSWVVYTKPVGTAAPTVTQTIDGIFNAGAKLLLWAGTVDSAATDSGVPYANNPILADSGVGYFGLHCYQSGGNITYQWFNWSGGQAVQSVTAPAGTPVVIVCRHDGGNLRLAKDGVSWSSPTASGNTDSMAGEAKFGLGTSGFNFKTAALVSCDATNSDANILTVVQQMGAMVGLSL